MTSGNAGPGTPEAGLGYRTEELSRFVSSYEQRTTRTGTRHRIRYRDGTKNQAVTFATKAQALAWKALLDATDPATALAALDEVGPAATGRTVAEQVAHHIAHLTGISEGTRARYTGYLRRRIEPDPLGTLPLTDATRTDYQAWVNRLADAGLSAKTIRNHHSVLSDALRSAVDAGDIPTNHAHRIRIATPDEDDHTDMVTLSLREVWQLIAATPEHWRPMVLFMFGTGVRWQEASALKAGDVDLARGQARIVRAWKDTAGHGHRLGKPKSKRSRRTIVFGHWVAEVLERDCLPKKTPDEFVFTNTRGGPVRYQNFHDQAWAAAVHTFAGDQLVKTRPASGRGRSRIDWEPGPGKRPTPHDARHTYASLQIARGASMAFLQRQLGHESINTTIGLYTHLQTEDLRPLADVIDAPLELDQEPPRQIDP